MQSSSIHQVGADAARTSDGHDEDRITRKRPTYTCTRCRARRVKCDRAQPACSNCMKAKVPCIPPNSSNNMSRTSHLPNQPRRVRRQDDSRGRLERLEEMVARLSAEVKHRSAINRDNGDDEDKVQQDHASAPQRIEEGLRGMVVSNGQSGYFSPFSWMSVSEQIEDIRLVLEQEHFDSDVIFEDHTSHFFAGSMFQDVTPPYSSPVPLPDEVLSSTLIHMYMSRVDPIIRLVHIPSFLARLHQYRQARHQVSMDYDSSDYVNLPQSCSCVSHQCSHGISSPTPTDSKQLLQRTQGFEALMFAVYYAAASSATKDATNVVSFIEVGIDLDDVAAQCKQGAQLALEEAKLVQKDTLESLQALVLLLSVSSRGPDPRTPWIQLGLAIRIAQAIGVHRDGSHYNLKPIETEVRRRLWAQICLLDLRMAEERGCEPTILEGSYDTRLPLNISDHHLSQLELQENATQEPQQRPSDVFADGTQNDHQKVASDPRSLQRIEGPLGCNISTATPKRWACNGANPPSQSFSEMTFSLVRFEASRLLRKLLSPKYQLADSIFDDATTGNTSKLDKGEWVNQLENKFEYVYNVQNLDNADPIQRVTAKLARLLVGKARLVISLQDWKESCFKMSRSERGMTQKRLFNDAVTIIEQTIALGEGSSNSNWLWYVNLFTEIYASTFVLFNLAQGSMPPECDERAWRAINRLFPPTEITRDAYQWTPFQKTLALARVRQRERKLASMNTADAAELDFTTLNGDIFSGPSLSTSDIIKEVNFTFTDAFWLHPSAGELMPNSCFEFE